MKKYILFLLLLGGCLIGPKHVPPEVQVSEEWVDTASKDEPVVDWWNLFEEPLLTQYIAKAAIHNRDVLAAEANVLQAIALRQVAASSLYPQISADFNAAKTYFSKNGPIFAIGPAVGSLPGTVSTVTGLPFAVQIPQIQNLFNFLFDATWELDIFGKTQRSVEAAGAAIGTAIEQRNDILLTAMAEIARNYILLRANQKLAQLVEENVELLEKTASILRESFKDGYINRLDYENIQAQLSSAKAQLPPLVAEAYKNIYAISVLTGEPPETLLPELLPPQPLPKLPHEVAIGLRSEILRRRPDVRAAERQLASATANVGVAMASFFPTISLFGDGGLQSLNFGNLFDWKSRTFAYGGDLMTPLFQGGLLFGNLHASQAARTFAAENYMRVVLKALQEAEQFLTTYNQDIKRVGNLYETLQKYEILVMLTYERYEKGLVNQVQYLDMLRQYLSAEQSFINGETATLSDLISLYKALGGGWESSQECQKEP